MLFEESSELQTLRDFVRYAWSVFNRRRLHYGHGSDNPRDEAFHLVLGSLGLPWDIEAHFLDARLTSSEKRNLAQALRLRVEQRLPLPYILGEAWFMGLSFEVNRDVLIPRSPIAELLRNRLQPWVEDLQPRRILDLCCGSGCIGIAAALVFEDAEVVISDISPAALEVARRNVVRHGVGERVTVVQSDLYAGLEGRFDLILTNPPYVDEDDMASLPAEYLHEPRLGLASGADGLDCTRRIIEQARGYLTDEGLLLGEVGNSLPALLANYPDLPFVLPDLEYGGEGLFLLSAADLPH